jgi:hypothetical protein
MHNGLTQRKEEKGSSTQNKKYPKQKQKTPKITKTRVPM